MQSPKFTELVGAPPGVTVGATARVALVHVLLAGDALEEGVLYHCNTRREHSVDLWLWSSWVKISNHRLSIKNVFRIKLVRILLHAV